MTRFVFTAADHVLWPEKFEINWTNVGQHHLSVSTVTTTRHSTLSNTGTGDTNNGYNSSKIYITFTITTEKWKRVRPVA